MVVSVGYLGFSFTVVPLMVLAFLVEGAAAAGRAGCRG
jgi:hypothetical protein